MDKLIRILFENPILLFIVGAWIFGAISNAAAKAKNKQAEGGRSAARRSRRAARRSRREVAREAAVQQPLPQSPAQTVSSRPAKVGGVAKAGGGAPAGRGGRLSGSAAQTPEAIAREMRRMLGLEPEPPRPPRVEPPPLERPPEPVEIRTTSRDVGTRVDPHVGERIRDRHMAESKVGMPRGGRGAIGNLGGRAKANKRRASHSSRYPLDDLRKAIVINEILSPPVSVRSHEDRQPG